MASGYGEVVRREADRLAAYVLLMLSWPGAGASGR